MVIPGQTVRRVGLTAALIGALIALTLSTPRWRDLRWGGAGTYDFVQYWAAARLLKEGGNAYDAAELLAVEQAVEWPKPEALRFWSPPWTLILTLPLAFMSFGCATLLWTAVQTLAMLGSGLLLWRYFAPEEGHPWIGLVLPAVFFPCLSATLMGQISFWALVGTVGFLWAERRKWDVVAGASLGLLMIKPHVTYLFWVAALWWAWGSGRRRVLIGWLAALIGASGLVVLVSPDVFRNYAGAFGDPPLVWHSNTFGTWLRVLVSWELSWLQFVPSLLGGLGFLAWLWRRQGPWQWERLAGPLVLASVITAAYGWSFDQVILLPAVVTVVAALAEKPSGERVTILGALLVSQVGLWTMNHFGVPDAFNIWHAPVLAGLYWWGVKPARGEAAGESSAS